jgi:hypothetical protein
LLEQIIPSLTPGELVRISSKKKARLKPKSGKWVRFERYEVEVVET